MKNLFQLMFMSCILACMALPIKAQTVEAIYTNTTKSAFENKSYAIHKSAKLTLDGSFSVDYATNGFFRAVVQTMDVSPAPNSIQDRNQNITIETVENLSANSLNDGVRIEGSYQGPINGSWTVSGNVATFTPTDDYMPNEKVMITIDPTMTSSSAFWLPQKAHMTFIAKTDPATTNLDYANQIIGASNLPYFDVYSNGDFDQDGNLEIAFNDPVLQGSTLTGGTLFKEALFNDPSTTVKTSGTVNSILPIDLDEDGDLDLLLGGSLEPGSQWRKIVWYEKITTGYNTHVLDNGSYASYGDFDYDGDLDIVGLGSNLSLYRNNGSQTFNSEVISSAGETSLITADFNGDEFLDIITSSESVNSITLHTNDGTGSFSSQLLNGTATSIDQILSFDFDGDGDLDIAARLNNTIKVYWNDGTGIISSETTVLTKSNDFTSIDVGDLNGDGLMDITAATSLDAFFLQNNSGTFSSTTLNASRFGIRSLLLGDYDNNGTLDLSYAFYEPFVSGSVTTFSGAVSWQSNPPLGGSARSIPQSDEEVVEEIAEDVAETIEPMSTTIFPNPFRDKIKLQLANYEGVTATILDVSGKILTTPIELQSSETEFDMTGIDGNVFLLYLNKPDGPVTLRILKEN